MPGQRFRVVLLTGALLGPWIVGHSVRHRHALLLALLSLALAGAAAVLKPRMRVEQTGQLVLLALIWPAALVTAMASGFGLDRAGLIGCAALLVLIALSARLLLVSRIVPAGAHRTTRLLERSFPELMPIARAELGLFWFGLFRWRRSGSDTPPDAVRFPGTATGVESVLCLLTAGCFAIETPLLHMLLMHVCGEVVAVICTVLHVMLGIYLVGYAKSLLFRPTLLFPDRLEIRLGVVAQRVVPRASIEAIAPHDGKQVRNGDQRLFGLDEPNLRVATGGTGILFRVDDPKRLIRLLAVA